MKAFVVLFVIIFSAVSFGQRGTGAIKLGHYIPSATEGGFIIGYEGGKFIDRNLNIGLSLDWFHKSFVDKNLIRDFEEIYGIGGGAINELRAKTTLNDFPLMLNLTAKFPMAPFVKFFVTGGLGGEVLFISYRNFQNPDDNEFKAAFDFNWQIGTGILYELGYRSEIFGELSYHSSAPGWEYEIYDPYLGRDRIYERSFDMSGVMFRVGVRFYY